jgi:hypothetical protein
VLGKVSSEKDVRWIRRTDRRHYLANGRVQLKRQFVVGRQQRRFWLHSHAQFCAFIAFIAIRSFVAIRALIAVRSFIANRSFVAVRGFTATSSHFIATSSHFVATSSHVVGGDNRAREP